jgi:hypothetical protein
MDPRHEAEIAAFNASPAADALAAWLRALIEAPGEPAANDDIPPHANDNINMDEAA